MRKLATIREISNIRPIEGADKIVVAQVDGTVYPVAIFVSMQFMNILS